MGYHVIDPNDIPPEPDRPSEMRYISQAAEMENIGLRIYSVDPGEQIPLSGLHYHDEQEEAFYVVDGQLRVETPDREYIVDAGEFFVAEPGNPHRAFNSDASESAATVIGIGAPPISDGHSYDHED